MPGRSRCVRLSGFGPPMLAIMPTVFVLAVADGLRRGRRGAWWTAVTAQGILIWFAVLNMVLRYIDSVTTGSVFYGLDETSQIARSAIPVATPIVILALLLWSRGLFNAAAPPGSYRRFGYEADQGGIRAAKFPPHNVSSENLPIRRRNAQIGSGSQLHFPADSRVMRVRDE